MKPTFAIAAVVIAVLATVVIEEYRIKNLQAEIQRLRALPRETVPETGMPDMPPEAPGAGDDAVLPEPAAGGEDGEATAEATPALESIRRVPEDFPEPDEETVKSIALSPYSDLHYELGLTNRERAYLESLLDRRMERRQALATTWLEAAPGEREAIEAEIDEVEAETRREVAEFLNREGDMVAFTTYDEMRPAREMVVQMRPIMDQLGVALELNKELQAIAAIHEARKRNEAINWESVEGLKRVMAGDALEVFDAEWAAQTATLKQSVPTFLDEQEAEAFFASREQLGESIRASLKASTEQLSEEAE